MSGEAALGTMGCGCAVYIRVIGRELPAGERRDFAREAAAIIRDGGKIEALPFEDARERFGFRCGEHPEGYGRPVKNLPGIDYDATCDCKHVRRKHGGRGGGGRCGGADLFEDGGSTGVRFCQCSRYRPQKPAEASQRGLGL